MDKKSKKKAAAVDEGVYKLKEFGIMNEGSLESRFDAENWNLDSVKEGLRIIIISIDSENTYQANQEKLKMEFDMIGISAPIANAIRRILIAEVPTMAIDKVFLYTNTSIVQDEVLAHRLGLVPIKVDPRLFEYREPGDEEGTEEDTILFQLKIKCTRKINAPKSSGAEVQYDNFAVYSKDLEFVPIGNQRKMYGTDIRPVHEDILLAKLRPGHEIDLKVHCVKSIGREHAKFSPVATASYRLLPQIKLLEDICGEKAYRLAECFPKDTIKISKKKGKEIAKVRNARNITCSRNLCQHDDLKNAVEVSKVKQHFIFSVESTGALLPDVLVIEAINVLKEKCRYFLTELKSLKV